MSQGYLTFLLSFLQVFKQGLSYSESDALKPTESGLGRTEPEEQGCELICGTAGLQKEFSNKNGHCVLLQCLWHGATHSNFCSSYAHAQLAVITAPFWNRDVYKLCNIISWAAECHNCADAWRSWTVTYQLRPINITHTLEVHKYKIILNI